MNRMNRFLEIFWLVVSIISIILVIYVISTLGYKGNEILIILPGITIAMYVFRRSMAKRYKDH
jgi:hypothetical protein